MLKVSYRVDATRAGERTDFDKLVLDVETKPSIAPRDAVAFAEFLVVLTPSWWAHPGGDGSTSPDLEE